MFFFFNCCCFQRNNFHESLNCFVVNREANEFLKKLASQTGGRYHCSFGDVDGQLAAHQMLMEGFDDEDVC